MNSQASPDSKRVFIPYRPRPLQRVLHNDNTRFKVLVCHRRFGKTVFAINDGMKKLFTCPHPSPRVMYCAPFLKQAKSIVWDYLVHYSKNIPGAKARKIDLCVDYPNGGRFTLAGSDNADSHRGIYLDHVILDEYAQQSPRIFPEIFRPALSDRLGSATFIGTPKGRGNAFYDMYQRGLPDIGLPGWKSYLLTVADTHLIPEAELESARLEMSPEEFEQEFMCSFDAAIKGAYYGRVIADLQSQGRIGNVPHEPGLPVHTACDLGISDSFAIWFFQFVGREIHVINYKEFGGMGLADVIREMRTLPYNYGDHIAPHDIRVRELGTGVSRLEVASQLGLQYQVCRNIPVMDGIDASRNFLKKCWFDAKGCKYGIESLRNYRSQYDKLKRVESSKPLHDWTSHGADAFRYAAVTWGGAGNQPGLFSNQPDLSRLNRRAR